MATVRNIISTTQNTVPTTSKFNDEVRILSSVIITKLIELGVKEDRYNSLINLINLYNQILSQEFKIDNVQNFNNIFGVCLSVIKGSKLANICEMDKNYLCKLNEIIIYIINSTFILRKTYDIAIIIEEIKSCPNSISKTILLNYDKVEISNINELTIYFNNIMFHYDLILPVLKRLFYTDFNVVNSNKYILDKITLLFKDSSDIFTTYILERNNFTLSDLHNVSETSNNNLINIDMRCYTEAIQKIQKLHVELSSIFINLVDIIKTNNLSISYITKLINIIMILDSDLFQFIQSNRFNNNTANNIIELIPKLVDYTENNYDNLKKILLINDNSSSSSSSLTNSTNIDDNNSTDIDEPGSPILNAQDELEIVQKRKRKTTTTYTIKKKCNEYNIITKRKRAKPKIVLSDSDNDNSDYFIDDGDYSIDDNCQYPEQSSDTSCSNKTKKVSISKSELLEYINNMVFNSNNSLCTLKDLNNDISNLYDIIEGETIYIDLNISYNNRLFVQKDQYNDIIKIYNEISEYDLSSYVLPFLYLEYISFICYHYKLIIDSNTIKKLIYDMLTCNSEEIFVPYVVDFANTSYDDFYYKFRRNMSNKCSCGACKTGVTYKKTKYSSESNNKKPFKTKGNKIYKINDVSIKMVIGYSGVNQFSSIMCTRNIDKCNYIFKKEDIKCVNCTSKRNSLKYNYEKCENTYNYAMYSLQLLYELSFITNFKDN